MACFTKAIPVDTGITKDAETRVAPRRPTSFEKNTFGRCSMFLFYCSYWSVKIYCIFESVLADCVKHPSSSLADTTVVTIRKIDEEQTTEKVVCLHGF